MHKIFMKNLNKFNRLISNQSNIKFSSFLTFTVFSSSFVAFLAAADIVKTFAILMTVGINHTRFMN